MLRKRYRANLLLNKVQTFPLAPVLNGFAGVIATGSYSSSGPEGKINSAEHTQKPLVRSVFLQTSLILCISYCDDILKDVLPDNKVTSAVGKKKKTCSDSLQFLRSADVNRGAGSPLTLAFLGVRAEGAAEGVAGCQRPRGGGPSFRDGQGAAAEHSGG